MRMKKGGGGANSNPLRIKKSKSALTQSKSVSKRVVDSQNISPALLHNFRATIAIFFFVQRVSEQLNILHRYEYRCSRTSVTMVFREVQLQTLAFNAQIQR